MLVFDLEIVDFRGLGTVESPGHDGFADGGGGPLFNAHVQPALAGVVVAPVGVVGGDEAEAVAQRQQPVNRLAGVSFAVQQLAGGVEDFQAVEFADRFQPRHLESEPVGMGQDGNRAVFFDVVDGPLQ